MHTLLNLLGRPTDEELELAKQDAIRRDNLNKAIKELNSVQKRLDYMNAHINNVNKHDLKSLKAEEERINALIMDLTIDESDIEYYDPVPLHPDYSKKSDFSKGANKIKSKKQKIRKIYNINDAER